MLLILLSILVLFKFVLASETLEKMVIYPVPKLMVRAVNAMLGFVNEHTRKKFIITDDLVLVCKGEFECGFLSSPRFSC